MERIDSSFDEDAKGTGTITLGGTSEVGTKWEYKIQTKTPTTGQYTSDWLPIGERMLNLFGQEGWELVTDYKSYCIFKRPKKS